VEEDDGVLGLHGGDSQNRRCGWYTLASSAIIRTLFDSSNFLP
jgi:hypothetical protein